MDTQQKPPTNRRAILSLLFAALTILSFCIGVAPIPLTAVACYPTAALLGMVSLWMGTTALREVRQNGERGRRMALVSFWIGGLVLLAILCFTTITIYLFPYFIDFLRQAWKQIPASLPILNSRLSISSVSGILAGGSG
jgi:hypothetical protein